MAKMRPELSDFDLSRLTSLAEARFYRACRDQLRPDILVKHSAAILRASRTGTPEEIEADFVIFDPQRGMLVVEVKGGRVEYDPVLGQWRSTDKNGIQHSIKDPFRQATSQKYAILDLLREQPQWLTAVGGKILAGHSVFFPDGRVGSLGPQAPAEIVGEYADLDRMGTWVSSVFDYWQGKGTPNLQRLGINGLQIAERLFCSPVLVRPLVSARIRDEEIVRIQLTEQQTLLLQAINLRKEAAICGGAGTGKTLLAVERAKRLASRGLRTLLLCYNRGLADHLKVAVEAYSPNLHPMSFHQLCHWRTQVVQDEGGPDLLEEAKKMYRGEDLYDVQLPYALARSTELSRLRYDAIVVDEGQDFKEEYWLPLELLFNEDQQRTLYIFFDPNQTIYQCAASFPIKDPPFLLTANCRNTKFIHEAAYAFFKGEDTSPPPIEGEPPQLLIAPSLNAQCTKIHALITELIAREGVLPVEITVLVAGKNKQAYYADLSSKSLPAGAHWAEERHRVANAVTLDTVSRFKGLESAIVFLCGLHDIEADVVNEVYYVGLSRAKSRLFLAGTAEACKTILSSGCSRTADAAKAP